MSVVRGETAREKAREREGGRERERKREYIFGIGEHANIGIVNARACGTQKDSEWGLSLSD